MENSFWFRHFLLCNTLANEISFSQRGIKNINFAEIMQNIENGDYDKYSGSNIGRMQLLIGFFWIADHFFCKLHESNIREVFENLEDENKPLEELSKLSITEITNYYNNYCVGTINFSEVLTA